MSVIGGILLFAAGVIAGAGGLALHNMDVRRSVQRVERRKDAELARLRTAYDRLQEETGMMRQASDCADAFRRGKSAGRAQPMSDAERFARTFEGRRVKFANGGKGE